MERRGYADSITAERVKGAITVIGARKKVPELNAGKSSFYERGEPVLRDGRLNEEERAMIEKCVGAQFPKGYTMSVDWDACNECDRYPAFGEPCKTCKALFVSP